MMMSTATSTGGRWTSVLNLSLLAAFLVALPALIVRSRERSLYNNIEPERRLGLQVVGQKKSFKILQLADLHYGEAPHTAWGHEQDFESARVLDAVITMEQPDLIVLSGDQLTANDIDTNATCVYRLLLDQLKAYNIPWATVFGNHDDAPLERSVNGSIVKLPAKTSRDELLLVDQDYAPLSLTQKGPASLFGTSNYMLDVHGSDDEVAFQILFLDTGGGAIPIQLQENQVQWFQEQRNDTSIPMVAFQHIPTKEFEHNEETCVGFQDDGLDVISPDADVVDALDKDGNVHFLAVGHDHGNDYCCTYTDGSTNSTNSTNSSDSNLHVCFGRHSGHGGYGSWDRGARIYELYIDEEDTGSVSVEKQFDVMQPVFSWRSWVRMESGEIIDEYNPLGLDGNPFGADDEAEDCGSRRVLN